MIEVKDVVTLRVPYPDLNSDLAAKPHMYICIYKNGLDKELVKCQTFKPKHLNKKYKPINRVVEEPDDKRNPFINKTIIDCDKKLRLTELIIDKRLKASRGVCNELYMSIIGVIEIVKNIEVMYINVDELLSINHRIRKANKCK